ncbi:MAG TPA: PIG-L family deacetylase [Gemmatimonadaceae bacterium]|nr:PIG-L family deacetylase [Gemmatimonadaceae bacterium]
MFWTPNGWRLAALTLSIGAGPGHRNGSIRYQANSTRDFVIVAHQDDWQLFMGDVIAQRASAGDSITFIYLTAGDDGRDSVYWLGREQAALASARVLTGPEDTGPAAASCSTALVRTHSIRRCTTKATISWFLRLPDGRRNGAGFARYGNQSLRKLRRTASASITAVDRSATYHGWADLVGTVADLARGSETSGTPILHTTDPSIAINPHDHFDHRMAGFLVQDVRRAQNWKAWYYVGYALSTRAANRSADQSRKKTLLFRAYDDAMIGANPKWSAYAEHPRFYSDCMFRTYARRAPVAR